MNTVKEAASLISNGGVVVFPTETVYGIGADAFNPLAVARIYEIKNRPLSHPLIVHVSNLENAKKLVLDFPINALKLAERFWPGPLTLLLPKHPSVPDIVTAGLPHVGIRIPSHPIALKLLNECGKFIAAPSANLFGKLSATTYQQVIETLKDQVDYILEGGDCEVGLESTIIGFENDSPILFRRGGITEEEIELALGTPLLSRSGKSIAPGMLEMHYAPNTPIYFEEEIPLSITKSNCGLLVFKKRKIYSPYLSFEILSPEGDFREAAHHFFTYLAKLDKLKPQAIIVEKLPEVGLGKAMNERLRKAVATFK